MITEEQREILKDIFENHDSPEKIKISLDYSSRDMSILIMDLDDEWFSELKKEAINIPAAYENLKDKFIKDGMSKEEARGKAARIYNFQHPNNPVTRDHKDFSHLTSEEWNDITPAKILQND